MNFIRVLSPFEGQMIWSACVIEGSYTILNDEGFTASFKPWNGKIIYLIEYEKPVNTFDEAQRICIEHRRKR